MTRFLGTERSKLTTNYFSKMSFFSDKSSVKNEKVRKQFVVESDHSPTFTISNADIKRYLTKHPQRYFSQYDEVYAH